MSRDQMTNLHLQIAKVYVFQTQTTKLRLAAMCVP